MKKLKISFQSLFDNDQFTMVFAILAAEIAWFAVMMSQMTDTNRTIYNVPVQINYEGSIPQSLGLQRIGDTEIMISVNVTGKASKVQRLTADDFSASISLNSVNICSVKILRISRFGITSRYRFPSGSPRQVR